VLTEINLRCMPTAASVMGHAGQRSAGSRAIVLVYSAGQPAAITGLPPIAMLAAEAQPCWPLDTPTGRSGLGSQQCGTGRQQPEQTACLQNPVCPPGQNHCGRATRTVCSRRHGAFVGLGLKQFQPDR
jgi:hypothetical protein